MADEHAGPDMVLDSREEEVSWLKSGAMGGGEDGEGEEEAEAGGGLGGGEGDSG